MNWVCRSCPTETVYGDDVALCPVCMSELFLYQPPAHPPPGADKQEEPEKQKPETTSDALSWDRLHCWNCDTEAPDVSNTECLGCHRSLTPPALLIRFPGGEIEVEPGTSVELGRTGRHARLFRHHANVSRRHALVGVEPDGSAWIEPLATPNKTFLDGVELPDLTRRRLRARQQVRFALNLEGTAVVYER